MIILIDGSNLFYRSYYTQKGLTHKKQHIGGVYGMVNSVRKLAGDFHPNKIVVAWDVGKCKKRCSVYPQYKENRKDKFTQEEKENIRWQQQILKKIFKYLGVIQIEIPGIEADDIIGYLTKKLKKKNMVVSNDHDLFQCANEKTNIYYPKKDCIYKVKDIEKEYGFPLEYYIVYKAIVGDSSDNIGGISGIGPKRASKAIQDGLKNGCFNINPAWKDVVERNIYLMTVGLLLDKDDIKSIRSQYQKCFVIDKGEVKKVFKKYKFCSFTDNFNFFIKPFQEMNNGKKTR